MLALVKKPHIELSIQGEKTEEFIEWIRKKYVITVLADEERNDTVPIESTRYWKEMESNRIGNLLTGARLKAGLTQMQMAKKMGIRQNMVSDFERGKRTYSDSMAKRLSEILCVNENHIRYGNDSDRYTEN